MQPYSELANWDGSLSDVVVDSLGPPSPSETQSLSHNDDTPMYDQYHHKFMPDQNQSNQQVWISLSHALLNPANSTRWKKKKKD
jgi:hypothetical protein